jgi:hypothetical protein
MAIEHSKKPPAKSRAPLLDTGQFLRSDAFDPSAPDPQVIVQERKICAIAGRDSAKLFFQSEERGRILTGHPRGLCDLKSQ